ncbi:MAG: hypothetical protein U9Q15_02550 [Patescibacteria group bacterium]|nr:hypothetical protein [Patescibacteria group bacterium]
MNFPAEYIPETPFDYDQEGFFSALEMALSIPSEKKIEIINKLPVLGVQRIQKLLAVFEKEVADFKEMETKEEGKGKPVIDKKRQRAALEWEKVIMYFKKQGYEIERQKKVDAVRKKLAEV